MSKNKVNFEGLEKVLCTINQCPDCKEDTKEITENNLKYSYCKKCIKERRFKYNLIKYGINKDQYLKLFSEQKGRCKICNKHQSEMKFSLSVDHNHKNGKVRGLLCNQCNLGIGNLKDNIKILKNAIKYLKENNE